MRKPVGPRKRRVQENAQPHSEEGERIISAAERQADIIITDLSIHAHQAHGNALGGMTSDGRAWPDFWALSDTEKNAWRASIKIVLARHEELLSKKP